MTAAPPEHEGARPPWFRRRGVLLGGAVALVVAIAVVTDLPTAQSRASNIAGANAFLKEVNSDLAPCGYAVTEAYALRADQAGGGLLPSEAAQLPRMLQDDRYACTIANPSIYDLTTGIESPGTSVADQLGQAIAAATTWAAHDAVGAIADIQALTRHPGSAAGVRALARDTRALESDRLRARAFVDQADLQLGATLRQVAIPPVPSPGG